ncbi:hypothetical protein KC878_03160 [Candidatus Saccharibacteria bacterium]|nr:hypothetical protein [Candidatus Saccharibacteria bacterium]MCB9821722.1 hypothetical protein [Candidatus Nomurabacteria bacterium]
MVKTSKPRRSRSGERLKKTDKYRSFRLQKKIRPSNKRLPSWFSLTKRTFSHLKQNKIIYLKVSLIYAVLYLLLVRGIGRITDLDQWFNRIDLSTFGKNLNIFSEIISGATPRSGAAGVFQVVIFTLFSLALLWVIRSLRSGSKKLKALDAYYAGTEPFVPYILVFLFCILMLLPMGLGSLVIETARRNNLIISNWEQAGFLVFGLFMAAISLFLLVGGLFGLIVASLGKVRPAEAIAIGWRTVRHRRPLIVWRISAMLVVCMFIVTVSVLPVVFIYSAAAEYVFYLTIIFLLLFVHLYIYELYREVIE